MNGNAVKIVSAREPVENDQIISLKARMADVQVQMCALLDETLVLGLKWNFNLTESGGKHSCTQTLIREY